MASLLYVVGALVPIAVGYATWLGHSDSPHDRHERVREAVEGTKFSSGEISFRGGTVVFSENQSYKYRIRKLIPIARKLDGEATVTLHSDSGEISLRADGVGPTEFLSGTLKVNDRLGNGHPDFVCERDFAESDKVKLHIESWDESEILELLEDVPTHLHETLNNYSDDSESDSNE